MNDPLNEWSDYVRMYYARGVQLKEWYITPSKMDDAHWRILGEASKWAQDNSATLANAIYIGGTPEKGEAYGYVAWNGDHGRRRRCAIRILKSKRSRCHSTSRSGIAARPEERSDVSMTYPST